MTRARRTVSLFAATILGLVACVVTPSWAGAVGTTSYIKSNPSAGRFRLSTATEAAPLFLDSQDHAGVLRVAKHLQADLERVTSHKPRLAVGEQPSGHEVVIQIRKPPALLVSTQ